MVPANGDRIVIALQTLQRMNSIMRKLHIDDQTRFTRHFSLAEIGREGQERL
jgi:hypothetical protein